MRKQQRPVIDPKTIKKHSQIVKEQGQAFNVIGDRLPTDTGFKTNDFEGKTFETFYEHVLPGSCTALFLHDKKSRVIRVLDGAGFLTLVKNPADAENKWESEQHNLVPGDVFELKPEVAYRIATGSNVGLDLIIVQDAKYDSKLSQVQPALAIGDVPLNLLEPVNREDVIGSLQPRKRSTKAADQLQAVAVSRGRAAPAPTASADVIINKRPSMGNFGEDDAG